MWIIINSALIWSTQPQQIWRLYHSIDKQKQLNGEGMIVLNIWTEQ